MKHWRRREMHIGYWQATPNGKKQLGRPRRMLVDNIKIDLKETGW
jgi:hypothetical protein